jgi:hypothetical protein
MPPFLAVLKDGSGLGGQMIGKFIASKLLAGQALEFYQWGQQHVHRP